MHSVNSHHLWEEEKKRKHIMRKSLDNCENLRQIHQNLRLNMTKGFFEFGQSCRFFQSFQTPAEQAHQQTCFGYHVYSVKHHKPSIHSHFRIAKAHSRNDWNATEKAVQRYTPALQNRVRIQPCANVLQ